MPPEAFGSGICSFCGCGAATLATVSLIRSNSGILARYGGPRRWLGGGGGISSLVTARFTALFILSGVKVGIRTGSAAGVYIATNMVLYRNFRIHHVFGANTDVGKTVFSALLTLASVAADRSTFYLKPVSTGSLTHADDRCVSISYIFCEY